MMECIAMNTAPAGAFGSVRLLALVAAALLVPACGSSDVVQQGGAAPTAPLLSGLSVFPGALSPAFAPDVPVYSVLGSRFSQVSVTATAADPGATVLVNGVPVPSGTPSAAQALPGTFTVAAIEITVIPPGGFPGRSYFLVVERPYVKASNPGADDQFGYSVGISGDTMVVGAPGEDSAATGVNGNPADNSAVDSGAAYVFRRTGGAWSQEAYLKASNSEAGDAFGWSVAVSGDTIVVGAFREDSAATGVGGNQADNSAGTSGAAYVFRRTGNAWAQEAYLKASNTEGADGFGFTVAIHADTIAVGAPGEDSNATGVGGSQADNSALESGAAYVFRRTGTAWAQEAYLKASNTEADDSLGAAVAVHADTVVVGALGEDSNAIGVGGDPTDNSAPDSGAAYAFLRTGVAWAPQAYLKPSNTGSSDLFGAALALLGDVVVVGTPGRDIFASLDHGVAHVFRRTGVVWAPEAELAPVMTDPGDRFGSSVALNGDTIVVGAPGESSGATGVGGSQADNSAPGSGAAYAFRFTGGIWVRETYIKASNPEMADDFGFSLAMSGETMVVGAVGEDSPASGINGDQAGNSAPDSGAAYVFQ